jgi:hypothetical protein
MADDLSMPLSIVAVEVEVGELVLGSKVLVRDYLFQDQGGLGALSWVDSTRSWSGALGGILLHIARAVGGLLMFQSTRWLHSRM